MQLSVYSVILQPNREKNILPKGTKSAKTKIPKKLLFDAEASAKTVRCCCCCCYFDFFIYVQKQMSSVWYVLRLCTHFLLLLLQFRSCVVAFSCDFVFERSLSFFFAHCPLAGSCSIEKFDSIEQAHTLYTNIYCIYVRTENTKSVASIFCW